MTLRYVYFDIDKPSYDRATIQLWDGDDLMGAIFLRKKSHLPDDPDPHTPCWQVSGIDVVERFRRKGFGTKLYEEAARQAARQGMSLCSDTVMSVSNEALAFWEKQVRKGRAYWEVPGPAEHEGSNYDYGRFVLRRPISPTLSGPQKYEFPDVARDFFISPSASEKLQKFEVDLLWYLYSEDKGGRIDEYGMWDSGRCWTLAQALQDWIGRGTSLHWIVGRDLHSDRGIGPQHVVLKIGDHYLDSNGIYTKEELLGWWRDVEHYGDLSMKPFSPEEAALINVRCRPLERDQLEADFERYLKRP